MHIETPDFTIGFHVDRSRHCCVTSIYAGVGLGVNILSSGVGIVFVSSCHTFGLYHKNGLTDEIQIWHTSVTGPQGMP